MLWRAVSMARDCDEDRPANKKHSFAGRSRPGTILKTFMICP